ncbi:MAG: sensor histidine kinase [Myxococcota bacterium]
MSRLVQVLTNLVVNALRHTGDGDRITLGVVERESEVHVFVRDTGPGIPPDHLELVFGRYWQADETDRRGLGLGLYISRCILEGHHGRIWAESRVGAGSTFWLAVPRAP